MDKKLKRYMKDYLKSNWMLFIFSIIASYLCYQVSISDQELDSISIGHHLNNIIRPHDLHS
jgi:hypothetical protein